MSAWSEPSKESLRYLAEYELALGELEESGP